MFGLLSREPVVKPVNCTRICSLLATLIVTTVNNFTNILT